MTTLYIVVACLLLAGAITAVFFFLRKVSRSREIRTQRSRAYVAALNELIAGNTNKAVELFKEAVRFDTGNIDAYIKLGMLYRIEGNPAKAYKIHNELTIRRDLGKPVLLEIYRNIVDDLCDLKHYSEALDACDKILSLDPKNRWALDMQPVIYEMKKDWKNAFRYLKANADKSEETDHRLALYKIAHGKDLMDRGEFHDARILFKEAIKLDRSYPPSYLYLGDAYAREDRRDDAVKVWREFAETVPRKSHLVFDYLDRAYFEAGNYGAMEVFYTKIIEKDPDNHHALLKLGEIYFKKGDKDQAFEMTERSLKVCPESPEGMKNLIMYLNNSSDIRIIKEKALSLAKMVAKSATYTCRYCQYTSSDILVQCPSCDKMDAFDFS